eukprot:763936-Hanusia_phi.AAC.2
MTRPAVLTPLLLHPAPHTRLPAVLLGSSPFLLLREMQACCCRRSLQRRQGCNLFLLQRETEVPKQTRRGVVIEEGEEVVRTDVDEG